MSLSETRVFYISVILMLNVFNLPSLMSTASASYPAIQPAPYKIEQ